MTAERVAAESTQAETEAAHAPAPPLLRAGPLSSPAAVLALQRTAGNAAVGRMLAGTARRSLSRQPVAHPALKETYFYDRDHFNGRYDGLVERGAGRITLVMRVDMQLAPQFIDQRKGDFSEKTLSYFQYFKTGFKEVVERIWSGAHALRPVVPLDRNFKYETRVRVELTSTNPHAEIYLHPKTIDASTGEAARSCASAAKPDEVGVANLQEGDNVEKERFMEYKGEKLTFYGNTSAHEFGHLLGLDHINQRAPLRKKASGEWTDEDKYGVTPEQAVDLMGRGSMVSARNMTPFIKIAEEYGKEVAAARPEWNRWTAVNPG